MERPKPRIALSTKMTFNTEGKAEHSPAMTVMKAALEEYGAEVVVIDPRTAKPEDIRQYNAAVFMGNSLDIDPGKYGQAPHPATKSERVRQPAQSLEDHQLAVARADYEEAAMKIALEEKIPLLGICGGMQRLNTLLGGSLDQHINERHNVPAAGIYTPVQSVSIFPNTTLGGIAEKTKVLWTPKMVDDGKVFASDAINSAHHQAVKDVGKGLRIAARSKDDHTVEAVESTNPDQFILGLQWHPEFLPESPLSRKILGRVVAEAEKHLESKVEMAEKTESAYPGVADNKWQTAVRASQSKMANVVNGR